ncbi:merozoite surface protein 3, putative [Plasmodium malariae]|uniref:S-antigen protein n=1 Tax=Plasmodium malariae TaxID=5858 RepID=A0A1D3JJZ0_PLAMA|nr:merozoite surface protein 3, putative [Plasmodium malariae]SBT86741.1 merozoite surface protein 3, putative [Plasmodium malariae]
MNKIFNVTFYVFILSLCTCENIAKCIENTQNSEVTSQIKYNLRKNSSVSNIYLQNEQNNLESKENDIQNDKELDGNNNENNTNEEHSKISKSVKNINGIYIRQDISQLTKDSSNGTSITPEELEQANVKAQEDVSPVLVSLTDESGTVTNQPENSPDSGDGKSKESTVDSGTGDGVLVPQEKNINPTDELPQQSLQSETRDNDTLVTTTENQDQKTRTIEEQASDTEIKAGTTIPDTTRTDQEPLAEKTEQELGKEPGKPESSESSDSSIATALPDPPEPPKVSVSSTEQEREEEPFAEKSLDVSESPAETERQNLTSGDNTSQEAPAKSVLPTKEVQEDEEKKEPSTTPDAVAESLATQETLSEHTRMSTEIGPPPSQQKDEKQQGQQKEQMQEQKQEQKQEQQDVPQKEPHQEHQPTDLPPAPVKTPPPSQQDKPTGHGLVKIAEGVEGKNKNHGNNTRIPEKTKKEENQSALEIVDLTKEESLNVLDKDEEVAEEKEEVDETEEESKEDMDIIEEDDLQVKEEQDEVEEEEEEEEVDEVDEVDIPTEEGKKHAQENYHKTNKNGEEQKRVKNNIALNDKSAHKPLILNYKFNDNAEKVTEALVKTMISAVGGNTGIIDTLNDLAGDISHFVLNNT